MARTYKRNMVGIRTLDERWTGTSNRIHHKSTRNSKYLHDFILYCRWRCWTKISKEISATGKENCSGKSDKIKENIELSNYSPKHFLSALISLSSKLFLFFSDSGYLMPMEFLVSKIILPHLCIITHIDFRDFWSLFYKLSDAEAGIWSSTESNFLDNSARIAT